MLRPFRTGFDADDLPARSQWRTSEDRLLDEIYPARGVIGVRERLPHRSAGAIRMRAKQRGVRFGRPQQKGA